MGQGRFYHPGRPLCGGPCPKGRPHLRPKAEIVSGTISVAYDNNGASIINANVTVKVNDKKFTLKASIGS